MSQDEHRLIRAWVAAIGLSMKQANPALSLGEIYDAIAEELEQRRHFLISMQSQSQQNSTGSGLMSPGEGE